ncbi:MAG: cytochrome P450 [Acidimicrobiia bacterium]
MSIDAGALYDPEVFVRGVPHDLLAELRAHDPVHWHGDGPGSGRYVVTSHRFVRQLNRDWERFSSARLTVAGGEGAHRRTGPVTLLESDPPEHTAMRRLVSRGFTPRAVGALEATARSVAHDLVEQFVAAGGGDAAEALAAQLPLQVTGEMIGIPPDDRADILRWTSTTIGAGDPEVCAEPALAARALHAYLAYGQQHIRRRRAEPGDDVFSALVRSEIDGTTLTDEELGGWWQLLVTGSTETTRNLLSSGLMLLLDHPDQAALLAADPDLVDTAIEEMLRFVTPVMHHQRRVTERVHHESGTVFEPGDVVDLWMSAANRDPAVFADPDHFDVTRAENDHLSFGSGGPHFCLGASLARQEARAFFDALLPHLDRMQRSGPEARLRSTHFNSLKHLPVAVRP